jgi:hypothetical protein
MMVRESDIYADNYNPILKCDGPDSNSFIERYVCLAKNALFL